MFFDRCGVRGSPQLGQQPRRAFDVSEHESDGPGEEITPHQTNNATLTRPFPKPRAHFRSMLGNFVYWVPASRWKSRRAIRPRGTRTTRGVSPVPTGRATALTRYQPALSLTE